MSVYPKRLQPGEPVFVHVRVRGRRPQRPLVRILLERPCGETSVVHAFQPLVVPAPGVPAGDGEAPPTGLRRTSPVYLAARHLAGADGDNDALVSIIAKTQSSVHFHHTLPTGRDWPLGRYRIHLEMRVGGRVLGSDTAREAWFALERLLVRAVRRSGEGGDATIHNPGPLPVPARLCSVSDGAVWSRVVSLAPGDTVLDFRGPRAWLLYSEDRQGLALDDTVGVPVVRNEALAWRDRPERGEVLVHGAGTADLGWTLAGKARDLWLRADGLVRRDELRTGDDAAAYDALHADGLLVELPAADGEAA